LQPHVERVVVLLFTTTLVRAGEVSRSDLPHGPIFLLDMTSQTSAAVTYDIDECCACATASSSCTTSSNAGGARA
jgi:hypothetical protein